MIKKGSRNLRGDAGRKNPLDDQVEALTTLVKVCLKQIRDITAREAVLRWFVENQRPLTQEKYDEMYALALQQFDDHVQTEVSKATEIHKSAMLRRLLETHDSKPQ